MALSPIKESLSLGGFTGRNEPDHLSRMAITVTDSQQLQIRAQAHDDETLFLFRVVGIGNIQIGVVSCPNDNYNIIFIKTKYGYQDEIVGQIETTPIY